MLLDFDLGGSFHQTGNGEFMFRPVVRAVNNSIAGTLTGSVTGESAGSITGAEVWVDGGEDRIATALTGSDGSYTIMGLPAGNHTARATAETYDTVTVSVDIVAGNYTIQNFTIPTTE